ncbi:unnamed protein product [Moneuplotes crassus]|uniref:PAS domain-containing protein n=1 Tax=Euplotes crassus TaxID=5936 RepID=A0AAD1XW30_EUPCR|nr:unnamed protein product [Moneuplotes crassus]
MQKNDFQEIKDIALQLKDDLNNPMPIEAIKIKVNDLVNQIEEIVEENIERHMRSKSSIFDSHSESNATSPNPSTIQVQKNTDPMIDLTNPEQVLLASILQGSKLGSKVVSIRDASRFRSKKRNRRRYRKAASNSGAMHPYKERLNEENKFDQTSIKAINKQLKPSMLARRNLPRMDLSVSHISEETRKRKIPPTYTSSTADLDQKMINCLKKYMISLSDCENDFEDFQDSDFAEVIAKEVLSKPDYRRFVMKNSSLEKDRFEDQMQNSIFLLLNGIMSSVGLLSLTKNISKSKELDEKIPKLVELLSWICEVEKCSLYLYNNEKGCLYTKATTGRALKQLEISIKSENHVVNSFVNGKNIIQNNLKEDKFKSKEGDMNSDIFIRNYLCVPINYADFSIGVIELVNKTKGCNFGDYDTTLLEKVSKKLANGLLQEEMSTHMKAEKARETILEQKLNKTNLQIYAPLFNNLYKVIEDTLGFEKAVLYLYDSRIKIFYDLSKFSEVSKSSTSGKEDPNLHGVVKIHSKRGFIGKIFSEGEILAANTTEEVNSMLEIEEKNISNIYPELNVIKQTIGIPIESSTEEKIIGILQLYNMKPKDAYNSCNAFLEKNKDSISGLSEYLSTLIQQSEKSKEVMHKNEVLEKMANSTNECLIYTNTQSIIQMASSSASILFGVSKEKLIGARINQILNKNNPEMTLMINNSIMQKEREFLVIENIWFNLAPAKPKNEDSSTERVKKDDSHCKRIRINLCCFKMTKTVYSLGYIFVIQPIISK